MNLIILVLIAFGLTLALLLCTLWVSVLIVKQKTMNEKWLSRQNEMLKQKVHELIEKNTVLEAQIKNLGMAIVFPKESDNKILISNRVELMKISIPSLFHATSQIKSLGDSHARMQAKTYSSKEMYVSIPSGYGKEYVRELVARELTKWLMDNHFVIGTIDQRRGEITYGFKYLEHQP